MPEVRSKPGSKILLGRFVGEDEVHLSNSRWFGKLGSAITRRPHISGFSNEQAMLLRHKVSELLLSCQCL